MALKIPGNFANKGPCDSGFHVPTKTEWDNVLSMLTSLGLDNQADATYTDYLLIPPSFYLARATGQLEVRYNHRLWTCTMSSSTAAYAFMIHESSSSITHHVEVNTEKPANACNIRAFKDEPVTPTSGWTILYQGTGSDGIFRNSSKGLISIVAGDTCVTIQDKNVGATSARTSGDVTDANAGLYYQFGNNYGFPYSGATQFYTSRQSTSGYGPENPYLDSYFVKVSYNDWSSNTNYNIWGGQDAGKKIPTEPKSITYRVVTGEEVWYNPQLQLYSITSDSGNTWATIADRDLGASYPGQSGQLFQWGNNYGFPYTGTVTTASTTPNVTTYGPANPYSSSTFDRNTNTSAASYTYNMSLASTGYGANLWGYFSSNVTDRRGPCDVGMHVPTQSEANRLVNCLKNLGYTSAAAVESVIYLPCAGSLDLETGQPMNQGYTMRYWTCQPYSIAANSYIMYGGKQTETLSPVDFGMSQGGHASGFSIRPFYDEGIDPTEEPEGLSFGTFVQIGVSGSYELWYNEFEGIFSFTTDGRSTWCSIPDRNLGATTRRGGPSIGFDFYTEETCGKYYQWGNNYGFSYNGATNTQEGQISLCNYAIGVTGYSSNTFMTVDSGSWMANPVLNLWGEKTKTNEARQGPCSTGFHVPTVNEMKSLYSLRSYLSFPSNCYFRNYSTGGSSSSGSYMSSNIYRWTCETYSNSTSYGYRFYNDSSSTRNTAYGYYIRPFKDVPVVPDDTQGWYRTYQGIATRTMNAAYSQGYKVRPPTATKIFLKTHSKSLVVGGTFTLETILSPEATHDTVTRGSLDTSIATVTSAGLVTAVALGTTTITAAVNGISDTCTITVLPANALAHWTFNETYGDNLGNYSLFSKGSATPSRYSIDSNKKALTCSTNLLLQTSAPSRTKGTLSMYVRPTSSTSGIPFCQGQTGSNYTILTELFFNSGYVYFRNRNGGSSTINGSWPYSFTTNTRYNVTLTQDGTDVKLYINGTLQQGTVTNSVWFDSMSGTDLYIGGRSGSSTGTSVMDYRHGNIGDTVIRSEALDDTQVASYVAASCTPYGITPPVIPTS